MSQRYDRTVGGMRSMVEKAGFGRASVKSHEENYGRMAVLSAGLLTLVAVSCGSLGLWRMGTDLDWAGDFVVANGFLSHWQVWIGAAAAVQYTSWWLVRYAGTLRSRMEIASAG